MKFSLCLISFLCAFTFRVYAQDMDDLLSVFQSDSTNVFELSMQELLSIKITTASKTEQNASVAPATMIVVTEEQIMIRGYQTLLDVLRDLPDFKVDENTSAEGNRISVRGISGQDKFIVMLDGVRISSPTNEVIPVHVNYPINLAEQIEIVYGSASALYGADAVSGVINIISKKNKQVGFIAKASSLIGTNGYTSSQVYLNKKVSDDLNVILSGQYIYGQQADLSKIYTHDADLRLDTSVYKNGNLSTKYGPMPSSKPTFQIPMKGYNIYGAIRFKEFLVSGISTYSQNSTSLGYNTSNALYTKDAFIGRTVNMVNAQYKKEINNFTFTTLLMGSHYYTDPNSNYQNVYVYLNKGYKYDNGTLLKVEEQVNWTISSKFKLIGGATMEQFNSVPKGGDLEAPVDLKSGFLGVYSGTKNVNNPNGIQARIYFLSYSNTGVYSQLQYTPNEILTFTLGGRYDYNTRFGPTINPRGSVVLSPNKKTTFKLLYNQAYLAPSPYITYQHYGSFQTADSGRTYSSNYWHLPNPKLKPIKSKNIEFSALQFIGSNFSLSLTSYLTFLTDLVKQTGDLNNYYNGEFLGYKVDYIETFTNQGKQTNYGGTLMLNQIIKLKGYRIKTYAGLSYVDGKTDYQVSNTETKRVEIDKISPFIFRIGTDLILNKFTASIRLVAMGKQRITLFEDPSNPSTRQTLAGYQLINISLHYKIYKGINVFTNIDNALNQKYYNISTGLATQNSEILKGVPQNPIRISLGLSLLM